MVIGHRTLVIIFLMRIHLFDKETNTESRPAGDVIFKEGDPGDVMFAVVEGSVEIQVHGKVVETVEAGSVFGEMALVDQRPRIATAVVKTDARLVRIDQKRFLFLVQQNPYFSVQLMAIMAERLRKMDEKL